MRFSRDQLPVVTNLLPNLAFGLVAACDSRMPIWPIGNVTSRCASPIPRLDTPGDREYLPSAARQSSLGSPYQP